MRKTIIRDAAPAKAVQIQILLDVILQLLNLLEAIGRIFGIDWDGEE